MEEDLIVQSDRKPEKWRRSVIFVVIFIVLASIIAFLWWLFQRPSQGTIVTVPASEEIDPAHPDHRKRYQGKYITFTYPYDFQRREEVEAVKHPLLERIYLSRSDIEGRKIALTLQDNSGNSFEEYSSFRIRRNDPGTYVEEKVERNGLDAVFFTKTTSVYEIGAFFHRGNQVVALVVSSPTTQNGLREELEALIDSFEWKGE